MQTDIAPRVSELAKGRSRVIPVLAVRDVEAAVPLAEALAGAGVALLEVTLRTENALKVIEAMARAVPEAIVGAGTLTRPEHFRAAADVGARFAVSPGLTPRLAEAALEAGLPYLPGTATASEVIAAREHGFYELKFFPADLIGGIAGLKHMQPLFPDVRFCPTGGVNEGNVAEFLRLPNVFAAGGGWLAPPKLIEAGDWAAIGRLAAAAVAAAAEADA
jgi:2-dehydro-3-deoxyphosphogluconate aldolase/(4S)-4-hydroxy-2-oxoglutarate aldolase